MRANFSDPLAAKCSPSTSAVQVHIRIDEAMESHFLKAVPIRDVARSDALPGLAQRPMNVLRKAGQKPGPDPSARLAADILR